MTTHHADSETAPHRHRTRALLIAAAWMLAGAAVALVVAVATGLVHLPAATSGSGAGPELWTCPMHPEILQEQPGKCPICNMDLVPVKDGHDHEGHETDARPPGPWTCPMHPEILDEQPGKCPICNMDLVPVKGDRDHAGDVHDHETGGRQAHQGTVVTIDPAVVQNMNVRTEPARRRDLRRSIRTVGHLEYDQERMVSVTTRYEGFVEKVFVAIVGETVHRGDPLFEVYSPALVQTQQELLSAVTYARRMAEADPGTRQRAEALVAAARQRLAYWDIEPEQIAEVERSGQVMRTLRVTSPIDGVIMKRVHGLEGMAIKPGMDVIHVVDLSALWLTVEIYEDQLPWLDPGSEARISLDYLPGETFNGTVRWIEPEVAAATRTVNLTLEVPNPRRRLRVGMYATVVFDPVAAAGAVVVPEQAVIRSGQRDVVVVALGDGRFEPHQVRLGLAADGFIQVKEGIEDGDEVVTSAQFLIDSESNLRAAIQKMIAGHDHS